MLAPRRLSRRLLPPLLALACLPACASASLGSYESCLRHDDDDAKPRSRRGATSSVDRGVWWDDWYGGGTPPRGPVLALTMTAHHCLYSVRVEGAGRAWEQGGFTFVDTSGFRESGAGDRLGFVGWVEKAAYVVIDGVKSPPYTSVIRGPSFSPDGRHAGYLARDASGAVAVVDGRVVGRAPDFQESLFAVLDDGRFGAVPRRPDGKYEVVVGDVRSPPVDEVCLASGQAVRPSGRFAFVGYRGGKRATFIDGKEIAAPWAAATCRAAFSDDDRRWAFIAAPNASELASLQEGAAREASAVVDGEVFPLRGELAGTTQDVWFVGGLVVVRVQKVEPAHRPRTWEKLHWLVDLPTPNARPTVDDYLPVDPGGGREWVRVKIGDSVGPRFDSVDFTKLVVDPNGAVHYTGKRGEVEVDVVDNVIVPRKKSRLSVPVP